MDSLLRRIAAWDSGSSARDRAADDNSLIKSFLSTGSNRDFERLVDRHKERVHRLVASVMGPSHSAEAEDITQDVFVQVYRKLSTFRKQSSFATWLYRIAFNKAMEQKKRARFRLPHAGEEALPAVAASDADADPARTAADRQRRHHVLECVENLDEPYRTVVYLHYWMSASVSDIAAYLGTRTGTVKSHLHRARARLARTMRREAEDE